MRSFAVGMAIVGCGLAMCSRPAAADDDHRGGLFGVAVAIRAPAWPAIDAALGYGIDRRVVVAARGEIGLLGEKDGSSAVGVMVRTWPFLRGFAGHLYADGHLDAVFISEEYDCVPRWPSGEDCSGGKARGLGLGASLGLQVLRGHHASLDVTVGWSRQSWHNAANGNAEHVDLAVFRLGATFY